jgi:hypothetical protein
MKTETPCSRSKANYDIQVVSESLCGLDIGATYCWTSGVYTETQAFFRGVKRCVLIGMRLVSDLEEETFYAIV